MTKKVLNENRLLVLMRYKIIILMIICSLILVSCKQNPYASLENNAKVDLNTTIEKMSTQSLKRVHILVEANESITSDKRKRTLTEIGVRDINYKGGENYIFSIPTVNINDLVNLDFIIKVRDVPTEWKLSEILLKGIYPDYAKEGTNKYKFIIEFYDDVNVTEALSLANKYGEIIDDNFDFNHLTVATSKDNITQLIKEDIIKRVEFINLPPKFS